MTYEDPIKRNQKERRLAWIVFLLLGMLALLPGLLHQPTPAPETVNHSPLGTPAP